MILLWPAAALIALVLVWRRRGTVRGRGAWWTVAWGVTGFFFALSLAAGLSVGLSAFPVVALALLTLAYQAPTWSGLLTFLLGAVAVLPLLAVLAR